VGGTELSLEGGTVDQLLAALIATAGPAMEHLLFVDGALSRDARVLKNGRNIGLLEGLATSLEPNDTVTVYFFGSRAYPGG
jgi:molybdopterin converting factor small subunit